MMTEKSKNNSPSAKDSTPRSADVIDLPAGTSPRHSRHQCHLKPHNSCDQGAFSFLALTWLNSLLPAVTAISLL